MTNKEKVAHTVSEVGNAGYEHYELSFKGDIDSNRYDYGDFNSDLDAINSYELMNDSDVKTEDIFAVGAQYNQDIQTNKKNRVDELYWNLGDGD